MMTTEATVRKFFASSAFAVVGASSNPVSFGPKQMSITVITLPRQPSKCSRRQRSWGSRPRGCSLVALTMTASSLPMSKAHLMQSWLAMAAGVTKGGAF
ncbi:hypothetical protein DER46DRAFT_609000 [Fusarium sp. MPI-SDFR-AT-0072]|nr:hypothetical protein DER46DRAFT_609000 [Fusarium sp. MPI-SDFR-AT-0072]